MSDSSAHRRLSTVLGHLVPETPRVSRHIGFIANPSTHGLYHTPPDIGREMRQSDSVQARQALAAQTGYGSSSVRRMASQYFSGAHWNPYYAVSRVFGGHTALHAQTEETRHGSTRVTRETTVGFNPTDTLSGLQIGMGAPEVVGRWHDDRGMRSDPAALHATVPVGAGVHGAFTNMQQGMLESRNAFGTYSWRPDSTGLHATPDRRRENCVTYGARVAYQFARAAQAHTSTMAELQARQAFARAHGATLKPSDVKRAQAIEQRTGMSTPMLASHGQVRDMRSLDHLGTMAHNMLSIAENARARNTGNQRRVLSGMTTGQVQAKL